MLKKVDESSLMPSLSPMNGWKLFNIEYTVIKYYLGHI